MQPDDGFVQSPLARRLAMEVMVRLPPRVPGSSGDVGSGASVIQASRAVVERLVHEELLSRRGGELDLVAVSQGRPPGPVQHHHRHACPGEAHRRHRRETRRAIERGGGWRRLR